MMLKYICEAFVLGVTMGGYCAINCAPFVVPYLLANSGNKFLGKIYIFGQFIFGRLVAYMLFAVVVSFLSISSGTLLSLRVNNILLTFASLFMIIFSLINTKIKFCQFKKLSAISKGFPVITGFILGLNLCPPFLVALVNILKMKSILGSCIYFSFLFLGTTIYLLPVVFVSAVLNADFFRRLGTYLGILVGIWFLIQGVTGIFYS